MKVLIDATALRTRSRQRGIGRYVFDLLHGLARVRGEAPDLALATIVGWRRGRPNVSADLAGAADEATAEVELSDANVWSRRRLLLGPAVLASGSSLLHMPEMRGTPIAPVPLLATCHDLIPLRYPRHYLGSKRNADGTWRHSGIFAGYRRLRDYRRYRFARRVVAISRGTRADLIELLGVPAGRIDVIASGISLEKYREKKDQPAGSRRYLLYVGYCDYRKNVETMLDALAEVRRDHDVELRWAGDVVGDDRARVDRAIAARGLVGHVRMLGYVPDDELFALYQHAVGLVFLSRLEGFGLPVAEACASGCPVLVAANSGCDEVAGEAGTVVEPDDARGAARAIRAWLRDPIARARQVERGLERARHFDHERVAREYLASYRRAVG